MKTVMIDNCRITSLNSANVNPFELQNDMETVSNKKVVCHVCYFVFWLIFAFNIVVYDTICQ